MKASIPGLLFGATLSVTLGAQGSGAPQTSGRPAASVRVPRTISAHVIVRDNSGAPIEGVRVTIAGTTGSSLTDRTGSMTATLNPGSYRLRFDRDGFVPLERDVTIKPGPLPPIEVALDRVPPPPVPERPAVTPAPPPAPPAPVTAAPPTTRATPPLIVSIPNFLEKNFIGRDPLKESVLGCTSSSLTRLLQVRDPVAPHAHSAMDEVLYVVAGEGEIRVGDQTKAIDPASLTIVPRGVQHAISRRGKNPLIMLSLLTGAPCPEPSSGAPVAGP
jgi:mannose-6-phosphate isomerase-like protein (cupin superfamily)